MSITPESVEALTVGGQELIIKTDPHGFYFLDVEGHGARPVIAKERFTSLGEVRKARDAYVQNNMKMLIKRKNIDEMVAAPSIKERRKAEKIAASEDK